MTPQDAVIQNLDGDNHSIQQTEISEDNIAIHIVDMNPTRKEDLSQITQICDGLDLESDFLKNEIMKIMNLKQNDEKVDLSNFSATSM